MSKTSTLSFTVALAFALGLSACADSVGPTAVPVDGPRVDGGMTIGGSNLMTSDTTEVVYTDSEDGGDTTALDGGMTLGGGN